MSLLLLHQLVCNTLGLIVCHKPPSHVLYLENSNSTATYMYALQNKCVVYFKMRNISLLISVLFELYSFAKCCLEQMLSQHPHGCSKTWGGIWSPPLHNCARKIYSKLLQSPSNLLLPVPSGNWSIRKNEKIHKKDYIAAPI